MMNCIIWLEDFYYITFKTLSSVQLLEIGMKCEQPDY